MEGHQTAPPTGAEAQQGRHRQHRRHQRHGGHRLRAEVAGEAGGEHDAGQSEADSVALHSPGGIAGHHAGTPGIDAQQQGGSNGQDDFQSAEKRVHTDQLRF